MIRNQWYVVLESDEVRKGAVGVTRLGEKMVFWRGENGKVGAAIDRCPHRGAELGDGKIHAGHLQCPFHGFEFDPSGKCAVIPANGRQGVIPSAMRLTVYPTHEANGFIWIWWGSQPRKTWRHLLFLMISTVLLCGPRRVTYGMCIIRG